jgi:hypothetical protein
MLALIAARNAREGAKARRANALEGGKLELFDEELKRRGGDPGVNAAVARASV